MVQFCYFKLYLGLETVVLSCRLLQWMVPTKLFLLVLPGKIFRNSTRAFCVWVMALSNDFCSAQN